jgi:hypothetical protein
MRPTFLDSFSKFPEFNIFRNICSAFLIISAETPKTPIFYLFKTPYALEFFYTFPNFGGASNISTLL